MSKAGTTVHMVRRCVHCIIFTHCVIFTIIITTITCTHTLLLHIRITCTRTALRRDACGLRCCFTPRSRSRPRPRALALALALALPLPPLRHAPPPQRVRACWHAFKRSGITQPLGFTGNSRVLDPLRSFAAAPCRLASHFRVSPSVICRSAFKSSGSTQPKLLESHADRSTPVTGPRSAKLSLETPRCSW